MPAAYQITIVGHVDRKAAPEDWPDELCQVHVGEFDDQQQLVDSVNTVTSNIVLMGGMLVRDNPYQIKGKNLDTERRFVMLRMFTHLSARVRLITGEIPTVDKDGKVSLRSGGDITVN